MPLAAINTLDQAATVQGLRNIEDPRTGVNLCADNKVAVAASWDIANGLVPLTSAAKLSLETIAGKEGLEDTKGEGKLSEALGIINWYLETLDEYEDGVVMFVYNSQWGINPDATEQDKLSTQTLLNCLQLLKSTTSLVVLLSPEIKLPPELQPFVPIAEAPFPDEIELQELVRRVFSYADIEPTSQQVKECAEALLGLEIFPAEQSLAMSLNCYSELGDINYEDLWSRKAQMIEQTPGLSVYKGEASFDRIGGLDNLKQFIKRVHAGRRPPKAIIFIDEIEKAMQGSGAEGAGDSSGVSADFLAMILTYMQDNNATGILATGIPGMGKSEIAKAAGTEGNIPTVILDAGGMKNKYVGDSETNHRIAFKVISAISSGQVMFIATSNRISKLPPELRRRFTLGTWFFDSSTKSQRQAIWNVWVEHYLSKSDEDTSIEEFSGNWDFVKESKEWSGAEIRQCCDIAWQFGISLKEASSYVVPVVTSAPSMIKSLREEADNSFLSASLPGTYKMNRLTDSPQRVQRKPLLLT